MGESAEQIELIYGERFKEWQPLSEVERADMLRAEIGYALGEDALGLERFRNKYAAKMAGTPDARAFDIVSAPLGGGGSEFADIAHAAASIDTLEAFLREMKARFPDNDAIPPPGPAPQSPAAEAAPASPVSQQQSSSGVPRQPLPPARPSAAGRTALR